jgi:hypothetical protein
LVIGSAKIDGLEMKLPQGTELLAATVILAAVTIIWGGICFVIIQSIIN